MNRAADAAHSDDGFWAGRGVLVTGGAGFIGSWLVKTPARGGARVVVLDQATREPESELVRSGDVDRVTVVACELEDYAAVERAIGEHEMDTVFHLGAQTLVEVAHGAPLADAGEQRPRHVQRPRGLPACAPITSAVSWSRRATRPTESTKRSRTTRTMALAAAAIPTTCPRRARDLLAQAYRHTYDLPVAVTRCGNIYGGGDLNWSRIVPGTIRALLRGERPVIRSDGRSMRDYVYVRGRRRGYMLLGGTARAAGRAGEAFNFGHECAAPVLEIVDRLRTALGCDDLEPDIRDVARRRDPAPVALGREGAAASSGGRLATTSTRASRGRVEWYRSVPGMTRMPTSCGTASSSS